MMSFIVDYDDPTPPHQRLHDPLHHLGFSLAEPDVEGLGVLSPTERLQGARLDVAFCPELE